MERVLTEEFRVLRLQSRDIPKHLLSSGFDLASAVACVKVKYAQRLAKSPRRTNSLLGTVSGVLKSAGLNRPRHQSLTPVEEPQCNRCDERFNLLRRGERCALCRMAYCAKCCTKDLLMYEDNDSVELCVIRVLGAPLKEPDNALYLPVCDYCRTSMSNLQYNEAVMSHKHAELASQTRAILDAFRSLNQRKQLVATQFDKYAYLVSATGIESQAPSSLPTRQNNVMMLAKVQADVFDVLAQMSVLLLRLSKRDLPPDLSPGQQRLWTNMLQAFRVYYLNTHASAEQLKQSLEAYVPSDLLTEMQHSYDYYAINAVYLLIRQLGLELCQLHAKRSSATSNALDASLLAHLCQLFAVCDTDIAADMQAACEQALRDFDEHLDATRQFLQLSLQTSELLRSGDRSHRTALLVRLDDLLFEITEKLAAKAAESRFVRSKEALRSAHAAIATLLVERAA